MEIDLSSNMSCAEELSAILQKVEQKQHITNSTYKTLKDEFSWFEKNPSPMTRPPTLQKLLTAIGTIPPSSVESERVFSLTGNFVTKVRSRLGDDSIDALVFLKKYYQSK